MQNTDLLKALVLTLCKIVSELSGNAGIAIWTPRMRSVRSPFIPTVHWQGNAKKLEKKYLHIDSTFQSFPFLELTFHDSTHCHTSAIEGNNTH